MIFSRLSSSLGRKDETPNIELAEELVKSVAQHSESIAVCINLENVAPFIADLKKRGSHLSASQKERIDKILKGIDAI